MNETTRYQPQDASWRRQPVEQLRLLNPAFLGTLLYCAAKGHQQESQDQDGLPYALAFVALPVVLHKATRETLPRAINTSLAAWLSVNTSAQVGFPHRARALAPLVRQAVAVSSAGGLIELQGSSIVPSATVRRINQYGSQSASQEVINCAKKAVFVGRWFATSGDYPTVMALWGVRP
ncbi:three component ABC system middle component [Rhodanobacter lindaniclasticus]|jgi:hypothetical protein|uniref:three component ABC system middle component n=1 Tax=Rhodanobacter lindaniclasticus TaxID=75310 RepID=UPI0010A042F9|nr:three component ABC system middle component [Rhodanobacter lindaniclasticus]